MIGKFIESMSAERKQPVYVNEPGRIQDSTLTIRHLP
jgi:hypothetical protein